MIEIIASRTCGKFPISVATSLALEAAAGIHDDFPVSKAPLLGFQEIWINVRTLYRNLIGAIPSEFSKAIIPLEAAYALSQEMEVIESIISEYTSNTVKVVYYFSNYANMKSLFKLGVERVDNTENQKTYTYNLGETVKNLLKQQKQILVFENKLIATNKKKVMILTHHPIDLLWYKEFQELVLVESHTGRIKERAQWTDKYLDGKNLPPMPFRRDLIQVFGDKENFRPMASSIKNDVIELAKQYNWTALTTTDRIAYCIGQLKNPYARDLLKSILSS